MNKLSLDSFLEDWSKHRDAAITAMKKIDEMHSHTAHLVKLDAINSTLYGVKDCLIQVLSGKDVVSTVTAQEMLNAQQRSYTAIISTICRIFGLIVVILVGLKILAPQWLGGQ